MQESPRRSGRTVVLVLLLLATCYFADWSDDFSSYYNATRYTAFQQANGTKPAIAGGGLNATSTSAVFAMMTSPSQQPPSALEAVFGSPTGSSQSTADVRGRSAAADGSRQVGANLGFSLDGLGSRGAGYSLSGSSTYGPTGQSSTTGLSSGTGMSSAAASIFGPQ